ncbi:MAG: hypothetical protein VX438_19745 [Planctomycetota bacterium]|nr:hypothetical protein [Planctomycetota bacterium]
MKVGELKLAAWFLLICGSILFQFGCVSESNSKGTKPATAPHAHGDHGEHIGGNNPHKIELKDAPFNAKWAHAGDLVTITIVDNDYKNEIAIAASEIVISDKEGKNIFKMPPLKKNEDGKASVFELDDEKLEITMDHEPTLSVVVGDKTYKTTVIHIH